MIHIKGEDGKSGMGEGCHGADGKSITINVPIGTAIKKFEYNFFNFYF